MARDEERSSPLAGAARPAAASPPVEEAEGASTAHFIRIAGLTKRFGDVAAVDGVSFEVERGRTLALLGPSGCGKTTILRCIAGLETPDGGTIEIAGRPMFDATRRVDLAPERRELGIVFQSYAVWPHMTVAENVAFPLKVRGVPAGERVARARRMLETVGLAGFENRPATLVSGGQQQRVALARALVHEPRLVLFDEALSNLDAQLREQMRLELRLLQQRLGFTAIYVTHDQAEAFGLADTVVLMNQGRIETAGPAREVFRRPASAFVARFFGLNVLEGHARASGARGFEVVLNDRLVITTPPVDGIAAGAPVLACIRKEHVRIERADPPRPTDGVIAAASFLGTAEEYLVEIAGVVLRATRPAAGFTSGDRVRVATSPEDWIVLPR
ncbi:MAG: ABC transporter ATP-binding protein, partial [Proteobacteria bacterium]|nr:ABC transporter ATP-binding protein [Pseudomonadota bacterium]